MKTVNNKILKSIISIGFNKKGDITYNINLSKINKLNNYNLNKIETALNAIKITINESSYSEIKQPTIKNNTQHLHVINTYMLKTNIFFDKIITIDHLIDVEVYIKNNRKLEAIKKFMLYSGCGLKDGIDFIEWYVLRINYKFESFR